MQRTTSKKMSGHADLRQHFHNYFELLLGAERSRLLHAIGNADVKVEQRDLLAEIDCRISYLRGAVRMGKLLCLIDQDEAKTSFGMLSDERERLRTSALEGNLYGLEKIVDGSARIELIRRSLHPTV